VAGRFGADVVIDRPIDEVFAFLANGENDRKWSPRVLEIKKTTDGPVGAGTVYESTVKDAGMKTSRRLELTEFESPRKIRWAERSKNLVVAREGGYDLEPAGEGTTKVTFFNELEGRGFGKLLEGFAVRAARKGADDFVNLIKKAIESEPSPRQERPTEATPVHKPTAGAEPDSGDAAAGDDPPAGGSATS
jgi:carbon monoxide dehydrogenase subunit G